MCHRFLAPAGRPELLGVCPLCCPLCTKLISTVNRETHCMILCSIDCRLLWVQQGWQCCSLSRWPLMKKTEHRTQLADLFPRRLAEVNRQSGHPMHASGKVSAGRQSSNCWARTVPLVVDCSFINVPCPVLALSQLTPATACGHGSVTP